MSAILEYTVEDKKAYVVKVGNVGKIHEKSSGGFVLDTLADDFELSLKLNVPGVVFLVEISPINVGSIGLQLLDKDGNTTEASTALFKDSNPSLIEFPASRTTKMLTSKLIINAAMRDHDKGGIGIKYLLVKGEKLGDPRSLSIKERNNISKRPFNFADPKESPHAPKVKPTNATFGERRKHKEEGRKGKEEGRKEGRELSEDEQVRMAIEASKREAEEKGLHVEDSSSWHPRREEKEKGEGNRARQQEKEWEEWEKAQRPREYPLVDFEKVKPFFANVSQAWVQAQRRAQLDAGIEEKHRLSACIQVRHFQGKTVCIDLPMAKRKTVEKLAVSMGAKVAEEVCDHCLLVTLRSDSDKVARARKMRNVRIVTQNFIEECKQAEAYLDERDYFLKL